MSATSPDSDVLVTTKPKEREKTSVRRQPPYHVVLENDDHHSMQFVVEVLLKVLGCTPERAIQFMLMAHQTGRAIVWTGSKEVAELKVEQICTFHEIREADGVKLGPLGCSIEPAPGG
ncbi:MAG TPA: ATP-dependent Clp protease adaptor ClpS [Gemmataceae bacterium]|jgi:ATP-dependent Clp protease adaptor protein ClpS|nr:ATP-dependent Clp protease adaptor ClpS [Gemmataceae bacterium]